MKMKIKLFAMLLVLTFISFVSTQKTYAQDTKQINKTEVHKVVFQLTSGDTTSQKSLIKQLNNLYNGFQPVQLEVVCHSAGISFLQKDKTHFAKEIKALKDKGVVFVACENTMKDKQLQKTDILEQADFVPIGLGEIVQKQEQGWSYIKAGNKWRLQKI